MSVHFLQTVHHLLSSFFEISVCTFQWSVQPSVAVFLCRLMVELLRAGADPQPGVGGSSSTTRSRGVLLILDRADVEVYEPSSTKGVRHQNFV